MATYTLNRNRKHMGAGGIAGAIVSLKNNRAQLRKRKRKDKGEVYGKGEATPLNLKQSTDQDMKRIRKKIEDYKRQERRLWIFSIMATAFLIYGLFWWLTR